MKKLFLLLGAVVVISLTSCGQTARDLPPGVQSAFTQKFPDATRVKWDKENDAEWEAEFILNGVEYSANFDNSGTWMETEHEISASDIPEAIKSTLDKAYPDYNIEVSEISETADGKVFEFSLKSGTKKVSVSIDSNGIVMEDEATEAGEAEADD